MRTLVTGLMVAVMTILLSPVAVAAHVLRIYPTERRVQQWCMRTWSRAISWAAGVRIVVHGAENIVPQRGTVYVCNHLSWFDIFVIGSVLPRFTFVAKEELRRIPIFGWGAEGAGVVFLSRENRKSAFEAYHAVAGLISEGLSVIVYPEGTRGVDYHLRPFKKGPFVLAIAAGATIVPTVIHGSREIMAKGSWRVRAGTVHVHLLPAVESAGLQYDGRHELMERVSDAMAHTLRSQYGVSGGDVVRSASMAERSA